MLTSITRFDCYIIVSSRLLSLASGSSSSSWFPGGRDHERKTTISTRRLPALSILSWLLKFIGLREDSRGEDMRDGRKEIEGKRNEGDDLGYELNSSSCLLCIFWCWDKKIREIRPKLKLPDPRNWIALHSLEKCSPFLWVSIMSLSLTDLFTPSRINLGFELLSPSEGHKSLFLIKYSYTSSFFFRLSLLFKSFLSFPPQPLPVLLQELLLLPSSSCSIPWVMCSSWIQDLSYNGWHRQPIEKAIIRKKKRQFPWKMEYFCLSHTSFLPHYQTIRSNFVTFTPLSFIHFCLICLKAQVNNVVSYKQYHD